MQHLIELAPESLADIDLSAILAIFDRLDPAGGWAVLALSATPSARPSVDLPTLRALLGSPGAARRVSLATLKALADNTLEISDALIIRPRTRDPISLQPIPSTPPAPDGDLAILAASAAAIARSGSGPWRLWLPDPWLAPFSLAFPGSREREPATSSLTA